MESQRTNLRRAKLCGLLMCAVCAGAQNAARAWEVMAIGDPPSLRAEGEAISSHTEIASRAAQGSRIAMTANGNPRTVSSYQMAGNTTALTDTALTFSATVDDDAAFVSIELPAWPQGVHFISAQSLPTRLATGTSGQASSGGTVIASEAKQPHKGTGTADTTTITVILSIGQPGDYTLPPLTVVVRGQEHSAPFPPLHIAQNPQTAVAAITLKAVNANGAPVLLDSVPAGQQVRLALAAQFVTEVKDVRWEVPNDAIFEAQYDDIPHRTNRGAGNGMGDDAAAKRIPTSFLWQPLTAGQAMLPVISCDVTALNGESRTITTQWQAVTVTEATAQKDAASNNVHLFPDAFEIEHITPASSSHSAIDTTSHIVTRGECEHLARLRSQERRSLFPWRVRSERAALEKSLGLLPSPNEMCRLPLAVCIMLGAMCIALSVTLYMEKSRRKVLLFSTITASLVFAALAIFCAVMILSPHGVFAGNAVRPVPDEASSAARLATGTCVRIKDSASSYLYVEGMTGAGWTLAADVIVIR